MKNKDKSGRLWKYSGIIIALLIMFSVGMQFINQSAIEEVSPKPERVVKDKKLKQENKQEEKTVLNIKPKKEKLFASSYVKKKKAEPKKEIEKIIAELVVVEDTIADKTSSEYVTNKIYPNTEVSLLSTSLIWIDFSKRYNSSERTPETILKDVEILTRNQEFTYIVDGVRVSEETFRALNPNDIESVDIYKHTDVTNALYGNKESQSRITLSNR